jgi:hypothetical protein
MKKINILTFTKETLTICGLIGTLYIGFTFFKEFKEVNPALKRVESEQIVIKEDIKALHNEIKTQDVKATTVIKYINDPALTKKIEEQTEIIRQFTEEVKKNGLSSSAKIQSSEIGSQE